MTVEEMEEQAEDLVAYHTPQTDLEACLWFVGAEICRRLEVLQEKRAEKEVAP